MKSVSKKLKYRVQLFLEKQKPINSPKQSDSVILDLIDCEYLALVGQRRLDFCGIQLASKVDFLPFFGPVQLQLGLGSFSLHSTITFFFFVGTDVRT